MKKKKFGFFVVLCMVLLLCGMTGCKKEEVETCKVEDCDEEVYKKGYCEEHYAEYKKNKENDGEPTNAPQVDNSNGDKTNDNKDNVPDGGTANPDDGKEVVTKAPGTYLSSMLANVPDKFNEVQTTVDEGSGVTVTADVKVSGSLLEMLKMYLSQISEKELNKLALNLSLDMDAKGEEFGLAGKFTLNGESLDAKVFLQDNKVYLGVPALNDKYLQLDITEFITGEESFEMPDFDEIDMDAIKKATEDFIQDITNAVTPSKEVENAVIEIRNSVTGIQTSVSGTMCVDIADGKKAMAALKKYIIAVMRAVGMPEEQISEMENEMTVNEDQDNIILSFIKGEDGEFAVTIENEKNGDGGQVKLINNAKYALFSVKEGNAAEDEVYFYAEKTGKKTGNIYVVNDGRVIDELKVSYTILDDGIKLSVKVDAGEAGSIAADIVLTEKDISIEVVFISGGEEWVRAKVAVKQRAYRNPFEGGLDVISNPDEWLETMTLDKVAEFLDKTLGISLEDLLGGVRGEDDGWDDSEWDIGA